MSLIASSTGRAGLSTSVPTSTRPSARPVISGSSPSRSSASAKSRITWVWVSSTETTSQIHLRETRSMIASAAIPHAEKCVVS
ncbi:hypothetical protein [Nonomuraea insulae]|uniref:Uncharacterized protein n=1 Tax=Nonomuraea insulae TaxID=1616787 RepID=A0ABW1CN49_9ACTN